MKKCLIVLAWILLVPLAGAAADAPLTDPGADPEDRGFPPGYHKAAPGPPPGKEIRKYADDPGSPPQKNFGIQPIPDNEPFAIFRGDRLEYQTKEGEGAFLWDVQGWAGGDYNKIWVKSEGLILIDQEKVESAEVELLWARNIASFWDLQLGVRHDFRPDPDRTFAAVGVEGLAPLWFDVEATGYVSEDGDVSAKLEVEYDFILSQRLFLQPRFKTAVALQEVEENGVGQGINDIELGLRLRYEIRREFAPYIGVSWSRKLGETADLAEAEGEDVEDTSFVAGVKIWF